MKILSAIVGAAILTIAYTSLGFAQTANVNAKTCLDCHNNESMLLIFRSPHGQHADIESPMAQLQCENCHGPGGEHAGRRNVGAGRAPLVTFGTDAATSITEQNAVCTECHASDVTLPWNGSAHERNETGCIGCHTIHSGKDPVTLRAEQANVCFDCHLQQKADARKPSTHPVDPNHPVRPAAMVCTDCHNPHAAISRGQLVHNTTNELCTSCHAEYRGPVLFEHAPVSEDCTLCHQPHGSIHQALLIRQAPLLCQSCHSQQGHPSLSYTDASLPGGNPSAMVLGRACMNCHTQVHGSNHPSGYDLMR